MLNILRLRNRKRIRTQKILIVFLLGLFPINSLSAQPNLSCKAIFEQRQTTYNREGLRALVEVMLLGSQQLSRTVIQGITPFYLEKREEDIATLAKQNFLEAAQFIVNNFQVLKIDRNTARKINRILTKDLSPEAVRGDLSYHDPVRVDLVDPFVGRTIHEFFDWLETSLEAARLYREDPVALAEIIHNSIVAFDTFPDGNGRLSRLFSDLVLIQRGYKPALYTNIEDYFARGSAVAMVPRQVRQKYYREIVEKGETAFWSFLESSDSKPDESKSP